MKNEFPGHFRLTDTEIKALWKTALFVFDANILLGLYRYSDTTRKELLDILRLVKNRCWLPYQAAHEYFNNRLAVIGEQEAAYDEAIKTLDKIEETFRSSHQHPFVSQSLMQKFSSVLNELKIELGHSKETHSKRTNSDDVLAAVEDLIGDQIGKPFSGEELASIFKEGEERYKRKLPPGYMDGKKEDEIEPGRKFGDLVLWKEILEKASKEGRGIIFVCDDKKEDWWLLFKGKTISPRPELVKEFKTVSSEAFHMYVSDRFLEYAGKYFNRKPSPDAVNEVRQIKMRHEIEEERAREQLAQRVVTRYSTIEERRARETHHVRLRMEALLVEKAILEKTRQQVIDMLLHSGSVEERGENLKKLNDLVAKSVQVEKEHAGLKERLADLDD